jgi:hypothetical protein
MRSALSLIVLVVLNLVCSPLMRADIKTLLTLDDEVGDSAALGVLSNNAVFCVDTGVGKACDSLGFPGLVNVGLSGGPHGIIDITNGTLGQFTINMTAIGGNLAVSPDLMSVSGDITSIYAGTLDIEFTDTDYTSTAGLSLTSSGTANPLSSFVSVCAFDDLANAIPASNEFACVNGFGSTGAPVNPPPGPYSLTQRITIVQTGAGTTTMTDPAIIATPEPAAAVLAGSMFLLMMAFLRRRFVKRANKPAWLESA